MSVSAPTGEHGLRVGEHGDADQILLFTRTLRWRRHSCPGLVGRVRRRLLGLPFYFCFLDPSSTSSSVPSLCNFKRLARFSPGTRGRGPVGGRADLTRAPGQQGQPPARRGQKSQPLTRGALSRGVRLGSPGGTRFPGEQWWLAHGSPQILTLRAAPPLGTPIPTHTRSGNGG